MFTIRHTSLLCREEGAALATLAARSDTPLAGFGLFGLVKEVHDEGGLAEFYNKYFTYPIYKDESLIFYNALGLRQLSPLKAILKQKTWNPYRIYKSYRKLITRLQSKKITGNMKGEGLVQGGIIIFDKAGVARYAYREETGSEIPIHDILLAIQAVRDEDGYVGGQTK